MPGKCKTSGPDKSADGGHSERIISLRAKILLFIVMTGLAILYSIFTYG
jgi:hypothetical protein